MRSGWRSRKRISSRRAGSCPTRYPFSAPNAASADSPPPPISPRPTRPLSVSTSTMVRTKRPQWQPLACRSGALSGTVTVVARTAVIFIVACGRIVPRGPSRYWLRRHPASLSASARLARAREEAMKQTLVTALALALAGIAQQALAGGQQVQAAVSETAGRSSCGPIAAARRPACRCAAPRRASSRASAGRSSSRSRPAASPASSTVARQWPAEGRWALVLSVQGGHGVSTLVTLEPGQALRIADQERSYERPGPDRIDTVLARVAAR